MGKLNINNGGVDTNKKMPDIDERFGPYTSIEAANAALGGQGRNTITAGLTVGILTANAGVKEWWYQPNKKTGQLELIPKGGNAADNPTEGNFASFDENGNVVDSGNKTDDFAPMEQAVPIGDTEDVGKILEKQASGFGWVDKPVDGDDAYHVWLEANGYDEKDHPVSEYNEYNRGKSAREIYNATYNKNLNDAEFAAELKMNYPMLHVGYDEDNAGATIGMPFDGNLDPNGDNIGASETTMGKLYLMPDDGQDPENCIGFVTVLDDTTYKWCSVGAIKIPSDVLAKSDVDNECTNGTVDTPASANFVMGLARKLQGVTFEETKVDNLEDYTNGGSYSGYYTIGTNGEAVWNENSSGNYKSTRIDVHEYDSVRFLGYALKNASVCYCFQDSNGDVITSTLKQYKDTTLESGVTILREYTINVPSDAYYLVCCYKNGSNGVLQPSNFYCYLQSGDTVKDIVNELDDKLYGYDIINTSYPSLDNIWGFVKSQDAEDLVTIDVDDYILRQTSPNASYSKNVTSYHGKKIRITAGQYDAYYAFSKKVWSGVGTYLTLQDAIDNDMFSEVHHTSDGWVNCFKINAGETVIVDIPNDAYSIYLVGKIVRSNDYSQESISRLPSQIEILEPNGDITKLNNAVDELNDNVDSIDQSVTTLDEEVYGTEIEAEVDGFSVASTQKGACGKTAFERPTNNNYVYAIKLDGYTKVDIQSNSSCYLCITKKSVDKTVSASVMKSTYIDSACYADERNEYQDATYRFVIPSNTETTIYLSPTSKWLYIQKQWNNTSYSNPVPSSITLYEKKKAGGLVELRDVIADNTNVISSSISFSQGYIDVDGKFKQDLNYVTSNPIPLDKGCLIMVNDDYRICAAHLFDNNGNLVNHREYFRSDQSTFGGYISYPLAIVLQQYNVRLTFMKMDDVANPNDNIIRYYCYLNDSRLIRKIPSNQEIRDWLTQYNTDNSQSFTIPNGFDIQAAYPIAYKKAKTILNTIWTPVVDAVMMNGSSTNYAKKEQLMHGIPYSIPGEYSKFVGQHVSVRTFLSAVKNIRSVVYTEDINEDRASTKYGINYHGSPYADSYYGDVCSSFVSYVQGVESFRMANTIRYIPNMINLFGYSVANANPTANDDPAIYGESSNPYPQVTINGVDKDPFDVLQPLDILWYTGHVMIITDVYVDEYNNNKVVVITEQTSPRTISTAYTKVSFRRRFDLTYLDKDNWSIFRYVGWGINSDKEYIQEFEKTGELVQRDFIEYKSLENVEIDKDIQCFAGDYAAFAIGNPDQTIDEYNNNKMFLNIHKGTDSEAYNTLQIFAEEDDETTDSPTYSISLSDASYVSASNIYSNDSEEGWVIADIAKYWWNNGTPRPYGKFKARVVKLENGSISTKDEDGSDIASGFVHFEMIELDFKVSGASGNYSIDFSTSGLPYCIRKEPIDGRPHPSSIKYLTDGVDYNTIDNIAVCVGLPISWAYQASYNFAKLYVRGEYGVVVRKVLLPQ